MGKTIYKKHIGPIKILEILKDQSDAEKGKYIKGNEIINALNANQKISHPTLVKMIKFLKDDAGYNIRCVKKKGYAYVNPTNKDQLDFIEKNIIASKWVSEEGVNSLVSVLYANQSMYGRKEISKFYKADQSFTIKQDEYLNTFSVIQKALKDNKGLKFDYYRFNKNKELEKRKYSEGGKTVRPCALICKDGSFVLLVASKQRNNILYPYRLEFLKNVRIHEGLTNVKLEDIKATKEYRDIKDYVDKNPNLISSKPLLIRMKVRSKKAYNSIYETFPAIINADEENNIVELICGIEYFSSWAIMHQWEVTVLTEEVVEHIKRKIYALNKQYKTNNEEIISLKQQLKDMNHSLQVANKTIEEKDQQINKLKKGKDQAWKHYHYLKKKMK